MPSSPSSSFDKDKVQDRDLHRKIEEYERSLASWTTRDNYAVGLIGATVSNIIQRRHLNPETQTAREMWLALEKNFQTRSLILDYHHRKSLKGFSWNNDASIRSNIMSIVMDLRALGHVITEVDQAMDLIMRLPQTTRWESVVNQLLTMLPQSKDDLTTFDGADNKVTFSFELSRNVSWKKLSKPHSPLLSRPNSKFAYLSPAEANDGDGIKRSMNKNGSIQ